jgi:hypothetical protein
MAAQAPDPVTQRLDRLERQNYRLRLWGGIVLVGLVTVLLLESVLPRRPARTVEAEKFILVGPGGNLRAGLSVEPNGMVGLAFLDKERRTRAGLAVQPDGSPSLRLFATDARSRVTLTVAPDGSPMLLLLGPDEQPRAMLVVRAGGSPGLQLLDTGGRVIWRAP